MRIPEGNGGLKVVKVGAFKSGREFSEKQYGARI